MSKNRITDIHTSTMTAREEEIYELLKNTHTCKGVLSQIDNTVDDNIILDLCNKIQNIIFTNNSVKFPRDINGN